MVPYSMPNRPKKPCAHPGCPNLTGGNNGGCDEHGDYNRTQYDRSRGTAASRGYDSAWSRFAKVYRTQHPLCAACERQGRVAPTEQVDHIIPLTTWSGTKYDPVNLQGLCRSCHTRKTAAESNSRSGRGHLIGGSTPLVPDVLPENPELVATYSMW